MDNDKNKQPGRGKQFKQALKNTFHLFKSPKEKPNESSTTDIHNFLHSQDSVTEQENQPLRQSEDNKHIKSDSVLDAQQEILSIQSTPSTLVKHSPASVLHRNPGHHPRNSNWPIDSVADNISPPRPSENTQVHDPFGPPEQANMMENRSAQGTGHQGGEKQQDYTEEKEELRAALADMMRRHVHLMDIGKYLIDRYYNRDEMFERIVTRMLDREEQYDKIAHSVLNWFGLIPDPRDFPMFVRDANHPNSQYGGNRPNRLPRNPRRPPPRTSVPHPPYVSRNAAVSRPMGYAQLDSPSHNNPTPQNIVTDDDFPSRARGRPSLLHRPIPLRPRLIVPRWSEDIIDQTNVELHERECEMTRRELESGNMNIHDDYDPPMLRPVAEERIQRGYSDEQLDGDQRPEHNERGRGARTSNPGLILRMEGGRYLN